MTRRPLVALLVIGILVAAFYSLRNTDEPLASNALAIAATPPVSQDGAGSSAIAASSREEASADLRSAEPSALATSQERVAERPTLATEANQAGVLRLSGTVRDRAGVPLGGVNVRIERFSSDEQASDEMLLAFWDGKAGLPIEDRAEIAVFARSHLAVTDEAGRFSIDGLPPGRARVEAVKHPLAIVRATSPVSRVGDSVHFVTRNQVQVEVRVLLPDGNRADAARLEITAADLVRREIWSASDPTVGLPEGSIQIEAGIPSDSVFAVSDDSTRSTARYLGMTSKPLQVDVRAGMPPIELRLDEQGGIHVEVESHPNFPSMSVEAAYCLPSEIVPMGASPDQITRVLVEDGRVRSLNRPRSRSAIVFSKLAPGQYDLFVAPSLISPLFLRQRVIVGTRMVFTTCRLSEIDLSSLLHVQLLFPGVKFEGGVSAQEEATGAQLEAQFPGLQLPTSDPRKDAAENARLELFANFGGDAVPVRTSTFTRSDLACALVPSILDWGALRPGTLPDSLTIRATHEEYGVGEATIDLATKYIEIPIVLPSASRLDVIVRNAGSVGASNRRLAVYAMRNSDSVSALISQDSPVGRWVAADGTAFFESLGPGDYALELWLTEENSELTDFQLGERRIRFVDTALVEFEVPAMQTLKVEVKGASECAVELSSFDDSTLDPRAMKTDAGGIALFTFLPPGRWLVGASDGAKFAQSLVRIPEQTSRSLELGVMNCYRVWITEPTGVLAKTGFQEGDLIVAIDEHRFDGGPTALLLNALSVLSKKASPQANATRHFTVVRNGMETDIEWTRTGALTISELGGTMTVWHRP